MRKKSRIIRSLLGNSALISGLLIIAAAFLLIGLGQSIGFPVLQWGGAALAVYGSVFAALGGVQVIFPYRKGVLSTARAKVAVVASILSVSMAVGGFVFRVFEGGCRYYNQGGVCVGYQFGPFADLGFLMLIQAAVLSILALLLFAFPEKKWGEDRLGPRAREKSLRNR